MEWEEEFVDAREELMRIIYDFQQDQADYEFGKTTFELARAIEFKLDEIQDMMSEIDEGNREE